MKECHDFGPKDRGSSSLGFIAHDCLIVRVPRVLLWFRLSSREENGACRFEILLLATQAIDQLPEFQPPPSLGKPECLCK